VLTGAGRAAVGDLVTATVTGTDGVDLIARTDGAPA
jgi:ribosomal protein S12 methylthiotransferase